jgi:hypothetical protein
VATRFSQPLIRLSTVLEGANPSAEGEDADDGGDTGEGKRVLDIEDQFRLNRIESKPSKKVFQSEIKGNAMPRSLKFRFDAN